MKKTKVISKMLCCIIAFVSWQMSHAQTTLYKVKPTDPIADASQPIPTISGDGCFECFGTDPLGLALKHHDTIANTLTFVISKRDYTVTSCRVNGDSIFNASATLELREEGSVTALGTVNVIGGQRWTTITVPTSIVPTPVDSIDVYVYHTTGSYNSRTGTLTIKRKTSADKVLPPSNLAATINSNNELVVTADVDPRATAHRIHIKRLESGGVEPFGCDECGYFDPEVNYGFTSFDSLQGLTYHLVPGTYSVKMRSAATGIDNHSYYSDTALLVVPASPNVGQLRRPIYQNIAASQTTATFTMLIDSRITTNGHQRTIVVEDNGVALTVDDLSNNGFVGETPVFNQSTVIDSIIPDSTIEVLVNNLQPGKKYIAITRTNDPDINGGEASLYSLQEFFTTPFPVSNTGMQVAPINCKVVQQSSVSYVISTNASSTVTLEVEIKDSVTGVWSSYTSGNFTPASPAWSSTGGLIYVTPSQGVTTAGSYRWRFNGGYGMSDWAYFCKDYCFGDTICSATIIIGHPPSPDPVEVGQTIHFTATVYGGGNPHPVVARVYNSTAKQTYLFPMNHMGGGSYSLDTTLPVTGQHFVRAIIDGTGIEAPNVHPFTVTPPPCSGVIFSLNRNGVSHLWWPFATLDYWETIGSTCHVGADDFAEDWNKMTGGATDCNTTVRAPFSGYIVKYNNACTPNCALHPNGLCSGYGNYILLQSSDDNRYFYRFAHMNAVYVGLGDFVPKGGALGTLGGTGNSYSPHAHTVLYYMQDGYWDDNRFKVSCNNIGNNNAIGAQIACQLNYDADCPDTTSGLLQMGAKINPSGNANTINGAVGIVNRNPYGHFVGTMQLMLLQTDGVLKSNNEITVDSMDIVLDPSETLLYYANKTGLTLSGNYLLYVRYRALGDTVWYNPISTSQYSNVAEFHSDQLMSASAVGEDESSQNTVIVYPNPVKDRLYIAGIDHNKITDIEIYNVSGQLLRRTNSVSGGINLSGLPQGNYLVRLRAEEKEYTYKVIKE